MSSDSLSLEGVTVRYGDLVAVDGVTVEVERGRVLALLGPSGCGKSTLLRSVAGLEPLAAGTIAWRGSDLTAVPVHQRRVGLMFQDHALFPHRNVADNIAFGLRMAGVGRAERRERVDQLLELVDLRDMGERTIGTLSGGQAQRVALARALAPDPEILLLDEPLAALDRTLRDELAQQIRALARRLDVTAVHVTHDLDEAMSVADEVAVMGEGRLRAQGRVDDLVADPGDVATARALGVDNVWPVTPGEQHAPTPFGPVDVSTRSSPGGCHLPPAAIAFAESGVEAEVLGCRHRAGRWLSTCRVGAWSDVVAESATRTDAGETVRLVADLTQIRILGD